MPPKKTTDPKKTTTAKKTTKAAPKKAVKKTPVKKTVAKKAPAKKTIAKKTPAKKTVAKKSTAPKTTVTKKLPVQKKAHTHQFAGFWKRVAIMHLEKFLQILITVSTGFTLLYIGEEVYENADWGFNIPIILFTVINIWLYFTKGRTIGDYIMKTKLVDAKTGKKPSAGKLIGRFFAKILSGLALGLGFFWAGWTKEKRAWHDSLSGTRYVETEQYAGGWTWLANILVMIPLSVFSTILSVGAISQIAGLQNPQTIQQIQPELFEYNQSQEFEDIDFSDLEDLLEEVEDTEE